MKAPQSGSKSQQNLLINKPSNKNIEINMSTLSNAQKQMCLKLLASSNINFEMDKDDNYFQAQLKIDTSKLSNEIVNNQEQVDGSQGLQLSPIKKDDNKIRAENRENRRSPFEKNKMAKQNVPLGSNKKPFIKNTQNKQPNINKQQQQILKTQKVVKNLAIYSNSKKLLRKTVRINNFTQLQQLHPQVELYIYPKKMQFQNLIELVEEAYQMYWEVEIHGVNGTINSHRTRRQIQSNPYTRKTNEVTRQYHEKPQTNNTQPYRNLKKKQTTDQKQPTTIKNQQQIQNRQSSSFAHWFYHNFIIVNREKIKAEQLLVNVIESVNHFSFKHQGIQIFANFLSGYYSSDVLNYFLVVRALLQQLSGERIIDRVSNFGSKAGVFYKIKLNPYLKQIQQNQVYDFLQVCFQGSKQQPSIETIFQWMTEKMFFDQKRRKNFIHYFDMVEILLREFVKMEGDSNSTNLELSLTQTINKEEEEQFGELLSYCERDNLNDNEEEMELTFQVRQKQQQSISKNGTEELQLNNYLPSVQDIYPQQTANQQQDCDHRVLVEPEGQHSRQQQFRAQITRQIMLKYQSLCKSISLPAQPNANQYPQQQTKNSYIIINSLIRAIIRHEKNDWIVTLRKFGKITQEKQQLQLHFIERLQKQYEQLQQSNFISNQFIKKVLTASFLREAILMQAGINMKTL